MNIPELNFERRRVMYPDVGERCRDASMKMIWLRMQLPRTEANIEAYRKARAEWASIVRGASDADLEIIARTMATSLPSWPRVIRNLGYENQLDYFRQKRNELRRGLVIGRREEKA